MEYKLIIIEEPIQKVNINDFSNTQSIIYGQNSTKRIKTYPTVKITNYTGLAKITVSLFPNKEDNKDCVYSLQGTTTVIKPIGVDHAIFDELRIIRNKTNDSSSPKTKASEKLPLEHILEEINLYDVEKDLQINNIESLRLHFAAEIMNSNSNLVQDIKPVVSATIYFNNPTLTLQIKKIDKKFGPCLGGENHIILYDETKKDDIEIWFFEKDDMGDTVWKSQAKFEKNDVHCQCAIVFKSPPYSNTNLKNPISVEIQLYSPSSNEISNSVKYTYIPIVTVGNILKQLHLSLWAYSVSGNVEQLLMPLSSLMSKQNTDGDNSLHSSIIHEQELSFFKMINVLKKKNDFKSINSINKLYQSPLYLAAATNQRTIFKELLSLQADWTIADNTSNTLFHVCVTNNSKECLAWLINMLTEENKDIVNRKNTDGYTALHLATMKGSLPLVRLLVNCQFVNLEEIEGNSGKTALHIAVGNDDLAIAACLILQGYVDVNKQMYNGNTALHIAASRNNQALVTILISVGADPMIRNYDHCTKDDYINVEKDSEEDISSDENVTVREGLLAKDFCLNNETLLQLLDSALTTPLTQFPPSVAKDTDSNPDNYQVSTSYVSKENISQPDARPEDSIPSTVEETEGKTEVEGEDIVCPPAELIRCTFTTGNDLPESEGAESGFYSYMPNT